MPTAVKTLSPIAAKNRALIAVYQAGGPGAREARDEVVAINQGLVCQIAIRHEGRGRGLDVADLVQEGNLGLLRAIEKFDLDNGCQFSTYAEYWIKMRILRAIRTQSYLVHVPNYIYELTRRVDKNHDIPITEEKRALLGHARRALRATGWIDGSHEVAAPELVRHEEDEEQRARDLKALRLALARLGARDRTILEMRFGLDGSRPKSSKVVGQELGISRDGTSQIQKRAQELLRRSLTTTGTEG